MQNYKYDKAIVPESKNGGSPALGSDPRKSGSKRALLVCLDLFCLFMGKPAPLVPGPMVPGAPAWTAPRPAPRCQFPGGPPQPPLELARGYGRP